MAFALDPSLPKDLLSHLVVVDISPAVGPVSPEFRRYADAMHEIDEAKVKTKKEGEEILKKYESVSTRNSKISVLNNNAWSGSVRERVLTP